MSLIQRLVKKLGQSNNSQRIPVRNLLDIPMPNYPPPGNWHVSFIEHIAAVTAPAVYVELGLYQCELFNRIEPYAGRLIGVDMKEEAGEFMVKSSKVAFVHSTTDELAASLTRDPISIDLLFIDADHSYQSIERDFWNFLPFVREHGLILLHDAHPGNPHLIEPGYCGDGYKTIYELSQHRETFELVTIPISPGLAICRKRQNQLSWM